MKTILLLFTCVLLSTSCKPTVNKENIKEEIYQTEKEFEKMALEKDIAEAFYFYADENAVIKREKDTLIIGNEGIKKYYEAKNFTNTTVNWTPDFIDVSDCGTLGYTYGKYSWKFKNSDGTESEYTGIFHTVWKKQPDNTWRYVWD